MVDDIPEYNDPDEKHIRRKRGGSLVLHFDDIDYVRNEKAVKTLTGTAMMALGPGLSSAWPIVARRTDEPDFDPHELDISDFTTLPAPVQESLNRGAVHWNPNFYPAPLKNPQP
jgi:hypothetical protein